MIQSQVNKLYDLLKDGEAHRTDEIMKIVYGGDHLGLARVGARVNDLIKRGCIFVDENGRPLVEKNKRRGWPDKFNPTLYWYRIQVSNDQLPAIHYEEFKTQPSLFPESKKEMSLHNLYLN